MTIGETPDVEAGAEKTAAGSLSGPVVLAARQFIVQMFEMALADLPNVLKTPQSGHAPQFTEETLAQFKAHVVRAVGLTTRPEEPPK